MKNILGLLVAVSFCGVASANTLVVTKVQTKGGTVVALDFSSSGSAASVDFYVDTGIRNNDKAFDLSGCANGLPGRPGKCAVENGVIYGGFFSPDMSTASKSAIALGKIVISAPIGDLNAKFEATDAQGQPIEAKSSVN